MSFAWKKAKAMREALGNVPLATQSGDRALATHRERSLNTYQVVA